MLYYIGFLMLVLFFGSITHSNMRSTELLKQNTVISEMWFLRIMFVALIAVFLVQNVGSNGDLIGYETAYNKYAKEGPLYFLENFNDMKDPIYHLIGNIISKLGLGFYVWRNLIGLLYVISIYFVIKNYSSNIYLSFICLISVGSFGFTLSGLRQTVAMSILFFSFKFLHNKQFWKFALIVAAASLFHSTALIFILAYPFYHLKVKLSNFVLIFITSSIILLYARPLSNLYIRLIGREDIYSSYVDRQTSLSFAGVIIFSCITLFCTVFIWSADNAKYKGLCYLSIISLAFRVLSVTSIAEFFRISMYFSMFDILMIAEACSCYSKEKPEDNRIKTLVVTILLFVYFFYSPANAIANFKFIW